MYKNYLAALLYAAAEALDTPDDLVEDELDILIFKLLKAAAELETEADQHHAPNA